MSPTKANLVEEGGCQVRMVHLDRVTRARKEAIPERELDRLALVYKLLGEPSRLKIAMALRGGEMCVCDLAALLGISESAVSHQIRRLKDLALVKSRREGQILYYSLDDHQVDELIRVGLDHVRE
ncbi:MAG: helix-turn-helix transcriptional regulator [Deltaproteobacteria bacterium]|nr:MAG: helix-turn-helix transcriptional regulator [Deltaproteobacteria bacterium]